MSTQTVSEGILARARGWRRGCVFTPRDFLDLGSRAAVDQALGRLTSAGAIRRLSHGVYDLPRIHPTAGPLSPSLEDVAAAMARRGGHQLQVSGATAANALGLSTQVPLRKVFLTDGTSRTVRVGKRVIEFRHASPRSLLGAGTMAGTVFQALRYLGRDGVDDRAVQKLRDALDPSDLAALAKLVPDAPAWMHGWLRALASPPSKVA